MALVRPHPDKGRGLYASQAYQPGDIILSLEPLLLLPSRSLLSTVCTHCFRRPSSSSSSSSAALRPCSRCRAAYYCNQTCQAASWTAVHSRECGPLRRNLVDERRRRDLPTPVRALIQALVSPAVQAALEHLEGHVARRKTTREWEHVRLMATGASAYAGLGTGPEAVERACELLSKIEMNAFQRSDTDWGLTGIFLEPMLAMANHSCIPNALVHFVGRRAFLRAGQAMQPGDEIEITYAAPTDPLPQRRLALSRYQFECRCVRCQGDLNVYQVAAAPPYPDLNARSLVTQFQHPAVASRDTLMAARRHCAASPLLSEDDAAELRRCLREQRELVAHELWAVSPLPDIVAAISVCYFKQGNRPLALATACFLATACDPFRFPHPFDAMRLNGLLAVAKLLSNTAADTAALTSVITDGGQPQGKTGQEQGVRETLAEIDQVSLCQMLLILILSATPAEYSADWEVSARAHEMLRDIDQLADRDRELSLIEAWRRDPTSDQSRAFFDYAVVQQVDALAQVGRAALLDYAA